MYVVHMGERRNTYKIFVKPRGKRLLGKLTFKQDYNITISFKEIGWEGADWINLAQDREKWQARINMITKLGFHKMQGISGLQGELLIFHK